MKVLKHTFDTSARIDLLPKGSKTPEEILFFDIETTGLSAASSQLYLIGCAYYSNSCWHSIQWLAQDPTEESELLTAFFTFSRSYKILIHFNGNTFDLPYLLHKCRALNLPYDFAHLEGIDIYKRISPYKYFLKLPNVKQKTVELFLGIHRTDQYTGKELIDKYLQYIRLLPHSAKHGSADAPLEASPALETLAPKAPDADHSLAYLLLEKELLLHNKDDLEGMLSLLPILAYYEIFEKGVTAKKVQANYYTTLEGKEEMELLMTLELPAELPKPISAAAGNCYFSAEGFTGKLKVPVYEEELKYFYSGHKDYYYLPEEDLALHKSVASFVDPAHRIPATAATCYTRKFSRYLPQWSVFMEPFFKRDYTSKELFFELTDDLKRNRPAFTAYANHVLSMIASTY